MTKNELKQIYYIEREIKMWQRKLDELNSKPTESAELEKAEMTAIVAGLLAKLQRRRRETMEYISGIEDSIIRQIMTCRYVDLMSWTKTAMIIGGGNTSDSVRKAHDRFLRRK